mmetsp:Transcript_13183/g.48065  ORF Transcript_13183/g.48065 Transcript_13183/m.48065 type:complete len:212 (-) Transcript_13183:691-1326(-)
MASAASAPSSEEPLSSTAAAGLLPTAPWESGQRMSSPSQLAAARSRYKDAVAPPGYAASIPWGVLAVAVEAEGRWWDSDEVQELFKEDHAMDRFMAAMPVRQRIVAEASGFSYEEYAAAFEPVKDTPALRQEMAKLTQAKFLLYNRVRPGDLAVGAEAPDVPLVPLEHPATKQLSWSNAPEVERQLPGRCTLRSFLPSDGRPLVFMAGSYT